MHGRAGGEGRRTTAPTLFIVGGLIVALGLALQSLLRQLAGRPGEGLIDEGFSDTAEDHAL
jgi:hypothetical protein